MGFKRLINTKLYRLINNYANDILTYVDYTISPSPPPPPPPGPIVQHASVLY
jgi:hypothetical protein